VPDIVRDGVTGLLVPPPDAPDHVDRLAGAVRLLLHDRRRREEMAEAALRTAAHAHGFDAAAADLDAILASAAATVPRRGVARR
jgi:glycosyltransferase involved in cell wall biosynthesis